MGQTLIERITETAAVLYRGRKRIPNGNKREVSNRNRKEIQIVVSKALDQYHITDPLERKTLYREICSCLGKRGSQKKKKMARDKKSKPKQLSFHFFFLT